MDPVWYDFKRVFAPWLIAVAPLSFSPLHDINDSPLYQITLSPATFTLLYLKHTLVGLSPPVSAAALQAVLLPVSPTVDFGFLKPATDTHSTAQEQDTRTRAHIRRGGVLVAERLVAGHVGNGAFRPRRKS